MSVEELVEAGIVDMWDSFGVVGILAFAVVQVVVGVLEIAMVVGSNLEESVAAVLEGIAGKYPVDIAAVRLVKV